MSAGSPPRSLLAWLLSVPWASITGARNLAYDTGLFTTHDSPLPTLCVGNISLGGVGKSPLVMHLAREISAARDFPLHGLRFGESPVAVLSRGYGRRSRGFVLVSRGEGPLVSVDQSGDESAVCARLCPGVWVAVCEDRLEGVRQLRQLGCGSVILDDGFQHRRLKRDLDLLIWDCGLDPASEALLPFGRLRESPRNAERAHALIFSRAGDASLLARRLTWFRQVTDAPAWVLELQPDGLYDPMSGNPLPVPAGNWGAFCGLGNPGQFEDSLQQSVGLPVHSRHFPDHHAFSTADILELQRAVKQDQLSCLVTTWKDWVRLPPAHGLPVVVLGQQVRLLPLD
ncbi:MAG: tetraacyldisaccharide 4'-kinase [Candidatus Cloacimonetes bacterium]|nr:tetraacyldisaccharide 4'-kinase [Candidatus Cloacimonadota bacterium]